MDDRDTKELFDLLKSIDASLKILVSRSSPVNITIVPSDVTTTPFPTQPWVNT